jgi:hypothetical protein
VKLIVTFAVPVDAGARSSTATGIELETVAYAIQDD